MANASPPLEDFHVGWICAVQTEYVVACELLDKEYPALPVSSALDNNAYTFGRIHRYNVVIACLPKGKYGLTSATSVAKDMLRSFPSIRFGLMVGIAGGAPSKKHDIRLGDVVVSSPTGRTGGVIHYEFGKTIQNRKLERTGALDAPPVMLLTALSVIGARHERKGHRIADTVQGMVDHNPRLRKKYARPETATDRLYESSFIHPDYEQSCDEVCGEETARLIRRHERTADEDDPVIHYGLIASADRLMKNAHVRDALAREEGVLCFEMEAAGLMEYFPCLVIRGICDYSDTHKNDMWQGYAAATAAAYAKELLEVVQSTAVSNLPTKLNQSERNELTVTHLESGAVAFEYDRVQNQVGEQHLTAGSVSSQAGKRSAYEDTPFGSHSPSASDITSKYELGVRLGYAPQIDEDYFIGRDKELELLQKWLVPQRKQNVVALCGMGGIGKTQLSIHFIKQSGGRYSSVFWLNAKDENTLKTELAALATELSETLTSSGPTDTYNEERLVQQARQWLSRQGNDKWLVVYDNYDDPQLPGINSRTGYDIRAYFPHRAQGSILITSRSPRLTFAKQFKLTTLDDINHSLAILATRSGRDVSGDDSAVKLVQRLDGLPLALATAGTYLRQTAESINEYLHAYEERWQELDETAEELLEYEDRTLFSTWNLSLTLIRSRFPEAAELLRLLAYFGNDKIDFDLLRTAEEPGLPWLSSLTENKRKFDKAMACLHSHHFVEISESTYRLHTCVHDWTLQALNREINQQYLWFAVRCVASRVQGESERDYWLANQRLIGHATRLEHGRLQRALDEEELDRSRSGYLHALGVLWKLQGQMSQSEQMYQRALVGYEKNLGSDHELTLTIVDNLGSLYKDHGRTAQSEQMYERALAGYEKLYGSDHPRTLNVYNGLGLLYLHQEKYTDAEQMFQRARTGFEKAFGPENISTLDTVHNLGILYSTQGKLAEAEQMFQQALVGTEKALRADHTSTLATVASLGNLYAKQGKIVEAEEMLLRSLRGNEKAWGPEHASTIRAVYNLGISYSWHGKTIEAEEMFARALLGYENLLGPDHTSTLKTLDNLGNMYSRQGKMAQAEEMYVRALRGYEKTFGGDNTLVLSMVWNLGGVYSQQPDKLATMIEFVSIWGTSCIKLFGDLGRLLLHNSDESNAQVAFQYQLVLLPDDSLVFYNVVCDRCACSITYAQKRYVCRRCPGIDLCGDCLIKHQAGIQPLLSCLDHSFLEIVAGELSEMKQETDLTRETQKAAWLHDLAIRYPKKAL